MRSVGSYAERRGGVGCDREAAGRKPAQCEVYKIHLGGGFGRRGATDFIRTAISIAKQMPGTPIKMIWSREEDMAQGRFHPVTQCKMVAGLDDRQESLA